MATIFRVAPRSGANIDEEAASLLMECQPECLDPLAPRRVDVETIFEFDLERLTNFSASYCDYPEGLEGCTDVTSRTCNISSSLNNSNDLQFLRSTIGHEIGHVVLHAPQILSAQRTYVFKDAKVSIHYGLPRVSDQIIPLYENCEWQANRFSAGLLMPTAPVMTCVQNSLSLTQIAQVFDVSVPFARSRLKGLKVLGNVQAF